MPEWTFICSAVFVFISFFSSLHTASPHSAMGVWTYSRNGYYQNTELIPPLSVLLQLPPLPTSTCLSLGFQSAGQDKPDQGAGSWIQAAFSVRDSSYLFVLLVISPSFKRRTDILVTKFSSRERDCLLYVDLLDFSVVHIKIVGWSSLRARFNQRKYAVRLPASAEQQI